MKQIRQAREWRFVRSGLIGIAIMAMALTAACDGSDPTLEEWEAQWQEVVETVESTIDEGVETDAVCDQTLGYLRERRPELSSVPLEDLREPVSAWFDEAEGLFFDCDWGENGSEDELRTLNTLEAEVQLVIELES